MKYRKKPVVVEAIQYEFSSALSWRNYNNIDEIKKFTNGSIKLQEYMSLSKVRSIDDGEKTFIPERHIQVTIPTLEGEMLVSEGDYIIKGVNGEFYPCKPDIFHKTYEEVK